MQSAAVGADRMANVQQCTHAGLGAHSAPGPHPAPPTALPRTWGSFTSPQRAPRTVPTCGKLACFCFLPCPPPTPFGKEGGKYYVVGPQAGPSQPHTLLTGPTRTLLIS